VRPEYTAEALRAAPPVDRNDRLVRDALGVPRVPEVADLVGQLTAGRQTQYDAVMEIFNYFSRDNGFVYSLSTRPGDSGPSTRSDTGGSAIVDFLRYKQGYCVQYSAAMAWLVRQAGFPARVAFGFTRGAGRPGTWSTLTNFNLHAWTEVYFAGYGWVPFDPTPATGVSGSANPAWAPNPSRPQDPSGTAQDAGSAAPGPQASGSVGADAGQPDDPGAAAGDTGGSGGTPAQWPLWVVPGVLAALAVAAIPAWQRRRLRRRRLRMRALPVPGPVGRRDAAAGEPVVVRDREPDWEAARRAAHAAWDELLDSMIDYGLPVDGAETPRATAARLAGEALPDPATAGVRLLGRAEEHARYSRSPLPSGDLAPSLAAARAAFAARASRRTRLRVAILPPSMLRRWQFTVSEAIGGVAAATATWSETIMRNVRLRSRIGDRTAR